MHFILMFALTAFQAGASDPFSVQAELQGLYDEISQATFQFATDLDIDEFHDVVYAPDWTLVDASGQRRTWPQVREQAVQALAQPLPNAIWQRIQKLTLAPAGATATVESIVERTIVDADGHYGKKGASHSITETTMFRDNWVNAGDHWKFKSREQLGQPKTLVDKPTY